jgi:hypothetical protein
LTPELGEDLVGVFGPGEGTAALVQPSQNQRIAAISSSTLAKSPRRSAWRSIIEKNASTRFSQDPWFGVKCRWTRGWPASQACGESFTRVALAPGDHGRARDTKPLGDLAVGDSLGSQQQDLGPLDQRGRGLGCVGPAAQDRLVTGADGQGSSRRWHPQTLPPRPPPVKSPQRRTTARSPS